MHTVDLVSLLQLGEPIRTATRAAAIRAEMVGIPPRGRLLQIARPAFIDRHELKAFREGSMHPSHPIATLATPHAIICIYTLIAHSLQALRK